MSKTVESEQNAATGFRRVLKNIGWLLGGKVFGAVCSLVYLAILVRSLGVKDFGHFALIFATAQAFVALSGFQVWQAIVKFGTPYILNGDWRRFGRLAVFGGVVDVLGAVIGCLMAFAIIYGFGTELELNPNYVDVAFLFVCTLLFARGSAAMGILRVLDRYDLAVYVNAVTPASRLLAACLIWWVGPTVERFLFAWGMIELITAVLLWIAAWRQKPEILKFGLVLQWKTTLDENVGIKRFMGITYANDSLMAILQQGPLLAVGYFLGTSAAGIYRVVDQLAKGMSKLSNLSTQALFPEINRLKHLSPGDEFRKLIRQINIMVILSGISVVILAMLLGEWTIQIIGGDGLSSANIVLIPLAIGAAFELASVAYEPVLYSTGHARYSFLVRLLSLVVLTIGILSFVSYGTIGVAWAVALGFATGYVLMSVTVWFVLRGMNVQPAEG